MCFSSWSSTATASIALPKPAIWSKQREETGAECWSSGAAGPTFRVPICVGWLGGTLVKEKIYKLFCNNDGQSVVEYGLLISLVVLVLATMVTAAQGHLGAIITTAAVAAPR
jgi:Flp pilus assembly pilin Flp